MNDSWTAIADNTGLRWFELETPHTIRFAQRRATRGNAECYWVVLTPEHAYLIRWQLLIGNSIAALGLLQKLALHIGAVAPADIDVSAGDSEYVTIPEDHDREWNY